MARKLPRGILFSAIVLLVGLLVLNAAWKNQSLYVPLETVDLGSTKPPLRFPFRAQASEEHLIHFLFSAGTHPMHEVKRRLNIGPTTGKSRVPDGIEFSWRITDLAGRTISAGNMNQLLGPYTDLHEKVSPYWPPLHLVQEEAYELEVNFDPTDEFITSLKPTVRITIDRGGWTDVHPAFPILFPAAKVILGVGFLSMGISILYLILRTRKNTSPVTTAPYAG